MKSNETILDLINKNASVNEICAITGLSHKQLFYRMNMLKIKGYSFGQKYYSTGDVVYSLNKNVIYNECLNEKTLITSPKETKIKTLIISDLHLGNINDRLDLLNELYNFCAKNNINVIINAGDLVDGPKGCGNIHYKKIIDVEEQMEYMLKNHPFDKNILNFVCLGNHDFYCMKQNGIDVKNVLENKRHDLVVLGYGYGVLNIKNDQIYVNHQINGLTMQNYGHIQNKIVLSGHSHIHKSIIGMDKHIFVPSLSDVKIEKSERKEFKEVPSVLIANLNFYNGVINTAVIEQLIFINNSMFKVNETQYEFSQGKNLHMLTIKNEEERKELDFKEFNNENPKTLKQTPKYTPGMSQVDKFKERYGYKN